MLARREFLKISGMLAAGTIVTLSSAGKIIAIDECPIPKNHGRPIMRFHGHARSGCSFRPELSDMWAGGGAEIPDNL